MFNRSFSRESFRTVKTIHRDEYKKLIEMLIETRKKANLSQQALADKLDKPQSYVSKYENRERRMDIIELMEVSKVLGINLADLLE